MTVREWYRRKINVLMWPFWIFLGLTGLWAGISRDHMVLWKFVVLYCLIAGFLLSMLWIVRIRCPRCSQPLGIPNLRDWNEVFLPFDGPCPHCSLKFDAKLPGNR